MKKILITGATGFLGSRLVEKMSTINGLERIGLSSLERAPIAPNKY